MQILNQKYTITRWGMGKIRELKSKSDYFQKYFIKVMNRKNSPQNSEKNGRFGGGVLTEKFFSASVWRGYSQRGVCLVNDTDCPNPIIIINEVVEDVPRSVRDVSEDICDDLL